MSCDGRAAKYVKLTQLEHVLARPDTYVGGLEPERLERWVVDGDRYARKPVTAPPALLKIFDEILTNAVDNCARDASTSIIKVTVNEGNVSVFNDGGTLPFDVHPTEGVHVPELVFGVLLTGSNFDDSESRSTAGRNGYGAKICNIFSSRFEIDLHDGEKRYRQTWTRNMHDVTPPKITAKKSKPSTIVTFRPDAARVGDVTPHVIEAFRKRAHDAAAVIGKDVKVFFDGKRLGADFEKYAKMHLPLDAKVVYCTTNEVEVAVALSVGGFEHVSFVNGVATPAGGTHVTAVADAVAREVAAKAGVKLTDVKKHLFVFVNARVVNPTFGTQSKERLTSKVSFEFTPAWLKKAVGVVLDAVVAAAADKLAKAVRKTDGAKRARVDVPKLVDAPLAGTARGAECSLILTEGDSAKALAVAGLAVVGRDRFGVYPLRGKLLNVRQASASTAAANEEITAIKKILGLRAGTLTAGDLRYGHVIIMTDADADGSHIAGLVLNFFEASFPSVLRIPGFIRRFVTPVVKARRGAEEVAFNTVAEYDAWRATGGDKGWTVKYYKGLGTSTAAEARSYFSDLPRHLKTLEFTPDTPEALDKAFSKTRAADRRDWIASSTAGDFLDAASENVAIPDFVDRELVQFSRADLDRSIPSVMDGLKVSQRKVLFAAFRRGLKTDTKVAQFGAYAAEVSAYHHGEVSLTSTIVGMAQDFVGSNNVEYLVPSGQFGTRLAGGKDAASARYIFTRLSDSTRKIFRPEDDDVLVYKTDDGDRVEPEWYAPIVPAVLFNGATGIGTGWSTHVPCYEPRAVVAATVTLVETGSFEGFESLKPWYRGFEGTVTAVSPGVYHTTGVARDARITELPIGVWTDSFKDTLLKRGIDFKESHTDRRVRFDLTGGSDAPAGLDGLDGLLCSTVRETNMHLFSPDGTIVKYMTPADIARDWFPVRENTYAARKSHALAELAALESLATNRARFVTEIIAGDLVVCGRTEMSVAADLGAREFDAHDGGYGYLLGMGISSLTVEKAAKLRAAAAVARARRVELEKSSVRDLWLADLADLAL